MRTAATLLALLALATPASARERRLTFDLSLGARVRNDSGYAQHAEVFGHPNAGAGFAVGLTAGYAIVPGLRVMATMSGVPAGPSAAPTSEPALRLANRSFLLQLGFTAVRREFDLGYLPCWFSMELSAGGGIELLDEELDGYRRSAAGPGAIGGARATLGTGAVSLGLAYSYRVTAVSLADRLGGEIGAGGHEIVWEFGLRF